MGCETTYGTHFVHALDAIDQARLVELSLSTNRFQQRGPRTHARDSYAFGVMTLATAVTLGSCDLDKVSYTNYPRCRTGVLGVLRPPFGHHSSQKEGHSCRALPFFYSFESGGKFENLSAASTHSDVSLDFFVVIISEMHHASS